jgi:hypothetical protein
MMILVMFVGEPENVLSVVDVDIQGRKTAMYVMVLVNVLIVMVPAESASPPPADEDLARGNHSRQNAFAPTVEPA